MTPGVSLTNHITIQGAGTIGLGGGIGSGNSVTNAGTVYVDQPDPSVINVSTGSFTRIGTLMGRQRYWLAFLA